MFKDFILTLLKQYGYPILFGGLAAEYLGMPFIPGEAMMSYFGFLGLSGAGLNIFYSIIFAAAGTFTGSIIAWFIGYRFGEKVVLKIGKPMHITKESLKKAELSFNKHRAALIIFSKFVPGFRHLVPYLSGISGVRAGTYTWLNLFSSLLWCTSFIGLGSVQGDKWRSVVNLAKAYSLVIILLFIFILVVIRYFKEHKIIIFSIAFPFLLFIKLCEDVIKQELTVFDDSVYNFIARFINPDLTYIMKFFTYCGSWPVLVSTTAIIFIALHKNRKRLYYGWLIVINLAASTMLNEMFKIVFHRQRPDILRLIDITGYSFPSGHSMISLCYYGLIAYILYKTLKTRWKYLIVFLLAVLIVSIGISRIYLGVHYASDVIGGFSAGLAWLAVFITFSNRVQKNMLQTVKGLSQNE